MFINFISIFVMKAFLLFIAVLLSFEIKGQDFELKKSFSKNVFYPYDFEVVNDSSYLIFDISYDYPVYLLNTNKLEIKNQLRIGRGPGEISTRYKHFISLEETIFIWDSGNQIGSYYDTDLQYLDDLEFEPTGLLYSIIPLSNNKLLTIDDETEFIKIFEKLNNGKYMPQNHFSISDNIFSDYTNPLLRQEIKFAVLGENIVLGHEYSSRISKLGTEGLLFSTTKPSDLLLKYENDSETLSVPDMHYSELCILDIDSYLDKYIFVLFKGRKVTKRELLANFTDPNILLEEMLHSNKILIYDIEGNFIKEKKLEKPFRKFEIYNNLLIGFNNLEEKSKFYVYDIKQNGF